MKRKIITLVLGTLILFIWNAVSWMALPFHSNALHTIPDSAIESETLKSVLQTDGIYHYPGFPEGESTESLEAIEQKLNEGPRITFMAYKAGSTELFDPKNFILNLLFNFLTVLLLLFLIEKQTDKTVKQVLISTLAIGLLIGFASDFPQMNWFMFPLEYTLPNVLDYLIAFTLIGLLFGMYTFKVKTG